MKFALILALGLMLAGALVFGMLRLGVAGDDLAVTGARLVTMPDGRRAVSGVVENRTRSDYSKVLVRIDLLDAGGRVIGNPSAAAEVIRGNEQWEFTIPIADDRAIAFHATVIASAQ